MMTKANCTGIAEAAFIDPPRHHDRKSFTVELFFAELG